MNIIKRFSLVTLAILMAGGGVSLSQTFSLTHMAGGPSWSVRVKTSGGLTGSESGSVLVTYAGKIVFDRPVATGKPGRRFRARLSEEAFRSVSNAVRRSRPEGWALAGLNAAAPDALKYELEFRDGVGEQEYKVEWHDNTRDQLPEDLKRLYEAVAHARHEAANR